VTGTGEADVARQAARSTALRRLAALGLGGYGLVHLLVAWLALQLAWNPRGPESGRTADPTGALAVLAASPGGTVVLWLLAVGLSGLTLWQAVELLRSRHTLATPGPDRRRGLLLLARTLGTACFYGYLTVTAVRAALTGGQHRGDEQRSVQGVLALPGGRALVVGVAVVAVLIGGYQVQKGWRTAFLSELDLDPVPDRLRAVTVLLCRAGFVAKGVAFVLVGGVLGWAAITVDPARATGLDAAFQALAVAPLGPWLLSVIAAGFATFSVYCFTRARHPVS
jgi:Domain of Unknown Function (DUF1206)